MRQVVQKQGLSISRKLTADEYLDSRGAYVELIKEAVEDAKRRGASDIHFQPEKSDIRIRFRIDGKLVDWRVFSKNHQLGLTFEFKRFGNLSVALSGKEQNSRVSLGGLGLDFRVNSMPSLYGERIVFRLLDTGAIFDLERSNFHENDITALREVTKQRNGLILLSGPTGSGKSRTLHTILSQLNDVTRNIITFEDPVEYQFKGINHVQVSDKFSFSDGLRSAMRQDPDVILIGEIRDQESAELCLRASATGHLVFSTVHTNGALEVLDRLLNLGTEPFLTLNNLRYSISQRLLRVACDKCSVPASSGLIKSISKDLGIKIPYGHYVSGQKGGCKSCEGKSLGRLPVLEIAKQNDLKQYHKNTEFKLSHSIYDSFLEWARIGKVKLEDIYAIA